MDLRSRTVGGPSQREDNGQVDEGSESDDCREAAENRQGVPPIPSRRESQEDETMPFELICNEPRPQSPPGTSRHSSPTRGHHLYGDHLELTLIHQGTLNLHSEIICAKICYLR